MRINISLLSLIVLMHSLHELALALTPDGLSLLSLKSAVDGGGGDAFSDWNEADSTPCRWTGVTCMNISGDPNPRVVGLSVAGKNLRGYIPSELGRLVYLRRLNLHSNDLYGPIPEPLFNATSLHNLFLYNNNLSGSLPPSICNLPQLQNLDLSKNSLSGPLPDGLRNCKQLQRLVLAVNGFSGDIPAGVWPAMESLVQLDISSNEFTGLIPEQIGELKYLSGTLNLSHNYLSGEIPKSLGNLPVTVSFDLKSNNLSGEIPQTGSFSNQGPTAFLDNPLLCGFPLKKPCEVSPESMSHNTSSASQTKGGSKKGLSTGLIVLISVADAAGVAIIGIIVVFIHWKKKDCNGCSCTGKITLGSINEKGHKFHCLFPCLGGMSSKGADDSEMEDPEKPGREGSGEGDLVAIDKGFTFELDELLRASAYVLGKSELGIIYKVVLGSGIPVAVRRLGEGGKQRYKEFVAEVQAIGKVKHPNIVRLRAYYWAPNEKLLINDYISNGNLASALRGKNGLPSSSLSWSTRLRIAQGTARGLAYLHECSPRKFIHGNIKPSNILLDFAFQPHISDFGLDRLFTITGNDPSSSGGFIGGALPYLKPVTTEGTNNYQAPEARLPGNKPTQRSDTYSFGIVLLELLTGKFPDLSPAATTTSLEEPHLVKLVRKGFDVETPLSDMVDPVLLEEVQVQEVLAAFHIAISCTQYDPEGRPRMKNVADNLAKIGT
ncbi:hypothetical protein SAY87_024312 [Trapa incisa]|uniref:non-specific serine/threonine protein kinase n=1 Tax=Trapa incisa TaxID=236973 RepID=A0AAN7JF25_9MYRT|nr:hypothetical protein SAY87_024312 [Trapa incisa]